MIIAVDFDGILCKNEFPKIGKPNYEIISLIRQLMDKGHEVILWTTRNGNELSQALDWCNSYGLHFESINSPAPSNEREYKGVYPVESRKIFADVYIDDHNIEFREEAGAMKYLIGYLERGLMKWKVKEEN